MFKILGLLSLSSAYALSVMYLAGVKLSDGQATAQGALSAALFFMISQAKPLPTLARARPHASVFTPYALLSLAGQAAAHVGLLAWAHGRADRLMADAAGPDARAPDADFAPNLVNTVAYLVNVQLMLATFGANYVGAPFCTPLSDAKALAKTLVWGSAGVAALLLGLVPGAERLLSLVRRERERRKSERRRRRLNLSVLIDLTKTTPFYFHRSASPTRSLPSSSPRARSTLRCAWCGSERCGRRCRRGGRGCCRGAGAGRRGVGRGRTRIEFLFSPVFFRV